MLNNMKEFYGVWVVTFMSQGTGGEMYNTLEGWNYGNDDTYDRDDGGAMSVLQEDVETVLGLQVDVGTCWMMLLKVNTHIQSSFQGYWAAVYSPLIGRRNHLKQLLARQWLRETSTWRFWRTW